MNNILVRSISGAVFISIILLPLFLQDSWLATSVLMAFALLGIIEFNKLFNNHSSISVSWQLNTFFSLLIAGGFIFALHGFFGDFRIPVLLFVPILFLWAITELWRKTDQPLINIGVSLFGFIYIIIPFLIAIFINYFDNNPFPLLVGMFVLIWTNDTFAFLSGKFFGKTKLFERISPKKTWEGSIGGAIFTVLMALALSLLFDPENIVFWLISAAIIVPTSILGDLLESLFKRSLNIKDSGSIMPGHGGILDRFDAAIFALPFFYIWLTIYSYFC